MILRHRALSLPVSSLILFSNFSPLCAQAAQPGAPAPVLVPNAKDPAVENSGPLNRALKTLEDLKANLEGGRPQAITPQPVKLPEAKDKLNEEQKQLLNELNIAKNKNVVIQNQMHAAGDARNASSDQRLGWHMAWGLSLIAGGGLAFGGALWSFLAFAGGAITLVGPILLTAGAALLGTAWGFHYAEQQAKDSGQDAGKRHSELINDESKNDERIRDLKSRLGVD